MKKIIAFTPEIEPSCWLAFLSLFGRTSAPTHTPPQTPPHTLPRTPLTRRPHLNQDQVQLVQAMLGKITKENITKIIVQITPHNNITPSSEGIEGVILIAYKWTDPTDPGTTKDHMLVLKGLQEEKADTAITATRFFETVYTPTPDTVIIKNEAREIKKTEPFRTLLALIRAAIPDEERHAGNHTGTIIKSLEDDLYLLIQSGIMGTNLIKPELRQLLFQEGAPEILLQLAEISMWAILSNHRDLIDFPIAIHNTSTGIPPGTPKEIHMNAGNIMSYENHLYPIDLNIQRPSSNIAHGEKLQKFLHAMTELRTALEANDPESEKQDLYIYLRKILTAWTTQTPSQNTCLLFLKKMEETAKKFETTGKKQIEATIKKLQEDTGIKEKTWITEYLESVLDAVHLWQHPEIAAARKIEAAEKEAAFRKAHPTWVVELDDSI